MLRESDLTPWFPGDIQPVHVGVYRSRHPSFGDRFQYWNGSSWGPSEFDVEGADIFGQLRKDWYPPSFWRGLAKEPKQC